MQAFNYLEVNPRGKRRVEMVAFGDQEGVTRVGTENLLCAF